MSPKAIQLAFDNKTPVTLVKKVQRIREQVFHPDLYIDVSELAGKPLRIWEVNLLPPNPFVRVGGRRVCRSVKVKDKSANESKTASIEAMIPIQAVRAIPKKIRGKKK